MSSQSEEWKILPFSNGDRCPPKLLYKFIAKSDGYELYVTDLLHCWKDSRDRQSITKEAVRQRCSIDPSEDATQFNVLLSKLRDGLSGMGEARCKIGPGWHDTAGRGLLGGFTLLSRTPLPEPLVPLRWTFNLLQEGRMLLTRELILPAMASELKQQTQIEDLTKRIVEKDHVITRLMDKIEQSSMDLSLVFPGYSTGKKGLNAKQATKVVPGISRFDETAWKNGYRHDDLATTRSLADAFRESGTDRLSFDGPRDRYGENAAWQPFGKAASYSGNWTESYEREPSFSEDEPPTDTGKDNGKGKEVSATLKELGKGADLPTEESTQAFEVRP